MLFRSRCQEACTKIGGQFDVVVTSPEVVSFAFAKRSNPTRTRVITRKATIAMIIVNVIFLSLLKDYNLIPEKIMNAIPIKPVMMNAIPGPRSAAGICE